MTEDSDINRTNDCSRRNNKAKPFDGRKSLEQFDGFCGLMDKLETRKGLKNPKADETKNKHAVEEVRSDREQEEESVYDSDDNDDYEEDMDSERQCNNNDSKVKNPYKERRSLEQFEGFCGLMDNIQTKTEFKTLVMKHEKEDKDETFKHIKKESHMRKVLALEANALGVSVDTYLQTHPIDKS